MLDVGCGTGVLARAAADRVAAEGQVTGLDLNDGMLAVARRLRPKIDWRQGDATKLPFADESYDVVMSQFSLMYFPDRIAALNEMWRVLRTGSQLAIAVWGPFERATAYVLLTEITKRRWGDAVTEVLTAPFVLGDQEKVIYLFKAAGIDEVAVEVPRHHEVSVDRRIRGDGGEGVARSENRIDEESYRSASKASPPTTSPRRTS